jgi:RNA:NAD 2'-phosphotransferase (TPT1/KptA family)
MGRANTISVAPVEDGWAVMLTDGRELARFYGPDAKREALRYVVSVNPVRRHPPIDMVRRARENRGGWRTASSQS